MGRSIHMIGLFERSRTCLKIKGECVEMYPNDNYCMVGDKCDRSVKRKSLERKGAESTGAVIC